MAMLNYEWHPGKCAMEIISACEGQQLPIQIPVTVSMQPADEPELNSPVSYEIYGHSEAQAVYFVMPSYSQPRHGQTCLFYFIL